MPSPSPERRPPSAGVDVGASLIKLALRRRDGSTELATLPAADLPEAARRLASARPGAVGLTGGGARRLARLTDAHAAQIDEFDAWAHGARGLLRSQGRAEDRFLLVSVGTGTSAMLVEGDAVQRVGGTALGGGTVLGLGAALLGAPRFEQIAELAAAGDRRNVDLLVADIYPEGGFTLPGEVNAASLAKLGSKGPRNPADVAHGVMGLVGENVALICCGLAAAVKVRAIVFGGSTLNGNPALTAILDGGCRVLGRDPVFLSDGGFAGALGALEIAAAS